MNEAPQQVPLAKPGQFRAYPLTWTIEPPKDPQKSQAVAIVIQFAIHQEYGRHADAGVWSAPWPPGYFTYGRSYVVGKDGQPNDTATKMLAEAGLWFGDWDALRDAPPRIFVVIDVESETYQGKPQIRANWIHPNSDTPPQRSGGLRPASDELLASLKARFGGAHRAIAGGKPGGGPPAPPPTPALAPSTTATPAPAPHPPSTTAAPASAPYPPSTTAATAAALPPNGAPPAPGLPPPPGPGGWAPPSAMPPPTASGPPDPMETEKPPF